MSSVRLIDLGRTTSFRLALLFLVLIGTGCLIVFGFLYVKTAGFLALDVDNSLTREIAVRAPKPVPELERLLNERAPLDPGGIRPFALFDGAGHWLAGSPAVLPQPLPQLDVPFDFSMPRGGEPVPYRGTLHRVTAGELLLAAEDMSQIYRFRRLLAAAMVSGGLVVLVIGLAGGMLGGAVALGRIDAVASAIERIVGGDLSERLPDGGTGGDLDRLIRVVNRMLDDLEGLMQEVKGVTDEIAHDLRTPLTRVVACLERARRRADTAEEYAVAVDEAIAEMRGIIATFGALLRIAEVESGARRAGFTNLDLNAVAADVADFYEPLAERKKIGLSLEPSKLPVELVGDPSLMFEAIGNLIDNAIKFSPPESEVVLRVFDDDRRLVGIEVCDNGPGIPAAERNLVLRRLHRAERSRHTPGSGLGLSLVAAVAKLHGMTLAIGDGNPGCRIRLWRAAPDPPGTERVEKAEAPTAIGGWVEHQV
jgi:signal transduction histidine kinase